MLMSSIRLPVPTIAVLLIGTLLFPLHEPPRPNRRSIAVPLPIADADAIKHKALQRLATEGTHISAVRQMQFEQAMRQVIEEQLAQLRLRYGVASPYLEAQIGYPYASRCPLDLFMAQRGRGRSASCRTKSMPP